ncbi:MAG: hypothetical protein GY828_06300 [Candidatus Gracilibacteria bacterium]|nr:hypothetical protein [Candidatus Gracilibacteria bacterium]
MRKYILTIFGIFCAFVSTLHTFAGSLKDEMNPVLKDEEGVVSSRINVGTGDEQVTSLLVWVRDAIDSLMPIAAVGVFLFVGIRLGMARGKPEEFKKAWLQFLYAIVGIFLIGFAWGAVKLVGGLNLNIQ